MESLKGRVKRQLVRLLPISIKTFMEQERDGKDQYRYQNTSYAQEGEDLLLSRFIEGRMNGFYVDVGAHHPMRFSNTYHFYLKGWRGINIDAMPGSMAPFEIARPRDINVEVPVYETSQTLTYYVFSEPAFNTFSEEVAREHIEEHGATLIAKESLRTKTLREILDRHLPAGTAIDFMSIDIEGLELSVLRSNDWQKYRPEFLLVETFVDSLTELSSKEIHQYLEQLGYTAIGKTRSTLCYHRQGALG
jgi:FkbM family methyltransferase